jgi:CheY-like chemotaxis protein
VVVVVGNSYRDTPSLRGEHRALVNGFLVKPITSSMLLEAIVSDDHTATGMALAPALPVKTRRLLGLRVLVVEDHPVNQLVAQGLLESEGALVSLAANGQLGVEAVAAAATGFDVVLMDVQMPVMDGYTASRYIRDELGLLELPIVAMTANTMAHDLEACRLAGMNNHVGKPFDMNQLVKLLTQLAPRSGST